MTNVQRRAATRPARKTEFSKIIAAVTILLLYPGVIVLSWRVIDLAELAILEKFSGSLPYLVAIITPAWAAVTTVIACYFSKAKAENKEKIRGGYRTGKIDY